MQQIFENLKQALRHRILILGVLGLSILSSLFIFVQQPSFAAPISTEGKKLLQMDKMEQESQAASSDAKDRDKAYAEQVKASQDIDQVYEDNLKSSQDEGPVKKAVEGAKKLVDQTVNND